MKSPLEQNSLLLSFFVMSRGLMQSKIRGHENKAAYICTFMMAEVSTHANKTVISNPINNELKKNICFTLKIHFLLQYDQRKRQDERFFIAYETTQQ